MPETTHSPSQAPSATPPQSRVEKLLTHIDTAHQSGLEIGALCRPIVPPDAGAIRYADHLDTAGLREKYAGDPQVDADSIVDVSVVWGERTLLQAVGDTRFDYVIASHVIEHVPDMVGWLREIAAILKPGGVLSLAIPDKRYTFDAARELTNFAAVVESYLQGRRNPGFREVLDFFSTVVAVPQQVTSAAIWAGEVQAQDIPSANPGIIEGLGEEGLRNYFNMINSGHYMDVHVLVVTPQSFLKLLERLAGVGLLDFRVIAFHPTLTNDMEFFVTLEKLHEKTSA